MSISTKRTILIFVSIIAFAVVSFIFNDSISFNVKAAASNNVLGYAWSENIGWISFNCTNTSCTSSNYGVSLDTVTGNLSGYAWSENIGWISFNSADVLGCPAGTCQPRYNSATNEFLGWARASANGGGWDGWVSLNSANCDSDGNGKVDVACGGDNSTTLVQNYKVTLNGDVFQGWAWGSDVVGWLSFNSKNCDVNGDGTSDGGAGCPPVGKTIPSYKVYLNYPPTVSNLATNSASFDYCTQAVTALILSWTFSGVEDGSTQTAYQVVITRDDSVTFDTGKVTSVGGSATSLTATAINTVQPGFIDFNHTYNWTVKVWDSNNLSDGPTSGPAFTTPVHKYPDVNFICSPSDTNCPPNHASYENITFTDQSTCYDTINNPVGCTSWTWDFCKDASCPNKTGTGETISHMYNSVSGVHYVDLAASDGLYTCHVQPPKPINALKQRWKEVVPAN